MEPKFTDDEHKFIWQEIKFIKSELKNHVYSKLERLDNRLWWVIGIIIASVVLAKLL